MHGISLFSHPVNDSTFGTSITGVKYSTFYTITVPSSSESLFLTSSTPENVVVRYEIDLKSDDADLTFSDPQNCYAAIIEATSTSADAYYRCTPELDSNNYWYQDLGLYAKPDGEGVQYKYLQREYNPEVNVTFERNSTANATVNFSNEFVEKTKTFLFLSNILTINTNHMIQSIIYNYLKDISPMKRDQDYGFIDYHPNPEPLEGELFTIYCEAIGRNPPHVKVERNGMKIIVGEGVSIRSSRTNEVSISSVTFLHATKNVEGNYSCVGEGEVRKVFPLHQIELKPKIRLDTQLIENVTDTVRILRSIGIVCHTAYLMIPYIMIPYEFIL